MIKTWRERLGLGDTYPLHGPTDVERAMVAEIADLRAVVELQESSKTAGDLRKCRSAPNMQEQKGVVDAQG